MVIVRKQSDSQRRPSSLNIVDTIGLFRMTSEFRSADRGQVSFNYSGLRDILAEERKRLGFRPADLSFAPAAIDMSSDSQKRFITALRAMDYVVDEVDYRATFISQPRSDDRNERTPSSLGTYMAYLMGLVAERGNAELIIVSGAFESYLPLVDFTRRGGRAAIMYFRRYLDPRWHHLGRIGDPDNAVKFVDLESHAETLLGEALGVPNAEAERPLGGLGRI